jgi:hypothetical protein
MKGLIAVLMLVLAVMVCVPQTAEAGIFGSRSRQVVVQKQVRQQVYVPQQFRQQFNGGHCNGVDNTGVLQLNNGCSALYGR